MVFKKKSVESSNLELDYLSCRNQFLQEHIEKLKESLEEQQLGISIETEKL